MHYRTPNTRRALAVIALALGLLSTSCAVGKKKLVSSHTAYNDAVQLTVTREVLTNIVRSRYTDPMQFMSVASINAQFSISSGGSANVAGIGASGSAGALGGSIGYSNSPTITYIPQSDAGFYKSMWEQFGVGETVGFGLSYRFTRKHPGLQALSLGLSFGSINGADDFVSGKYSELYLRRIEAIVRLFELGAVYRQVPEWDFDTTAISAEKVSAEDMVDAFQWGMNFIEEDGGKKLRLARYRLVLALTVPATDNPEVTQALEDLGVTPGNTQYVFRPPLHSAPGFEDPYAIWVTPRSMIDVINLAGRFVEVPKAHQMFVPPIEEGIDTSVAGLVRIRSSKDRPSYPYRIQHRGYWFYVDDTELESKAFLEAVVAAYTSRVGSKQAGDLAPQVVLPVGGG